ncbi:MAG: low temperature requirement protein A [Tetrasphaera sp.]
MSASEATSPEPHGLRPMGGRDPHERGRVATPLELLFDLTFVVAFSYAGNQMAHQVAAGHAWPGIIGFCFAMFGICWAWINFTWFASAFDTDDWFYRLVTMVQMIGVVIFAVGLPTMFHSMEEGHHIDNRVMVLGYVVMRVAMLAQWVRAGRQSPPHSRACRMYAATIFLAQLGWVILALLDTSVLVFALAAAVLILIETGGPAYAEARLGGTPWHPHHIAERYGLLAIITLGEGVVGAVVSLEAVTAASGWDWAAASFVLATMGLTFGLWWIYFAIPFGELLHHQRQRSFVFGYGHMVIFGAIAATGAGLHVLSYYLEGHHDPEEFGWVKIGQAGAVLAVAVPVVVFLVALVAIWQSLFRARDALHYVELALTVLALAGAVVLATAHVSIAISLIVIALAPAIVVIGYEMAGGDRNQLAALDRQRT